MYKEEILDYLNNLCPGGNTYYYWAYSTFNDGTIYRWVKDDNDYNTIKDILDRNEMPFSTERDGDKKIYVNIKDIITHRIFTQREIKLNELLS